MVVICGTAGVGKTTLALHFAQVAAREIGHREREVRTLMHLGEHLATDDHDGARAVVREALTILDDRGHPTPEKVRASLGRLESPT